MDDGQQRPGCMSGGTKDNKHVAIGCYSRALALTIDAVAGTARLLWQFAWPLDAPGDVDAEESEVRARSRRRRVVSPSISLAIDWWQRNATRVDKFRTATHKRMHVERQEPPPPTHARVILPSERQ